MVLRCRVLVESVDLLEDTAEITLVDEAVRQRVNTHELYELSLQFWSFPFMGWKFRLNDVKPVRNQRAWPQAAVNRLRGICKRGMIYRD